MLISADQEFILNRANRALQPLDLPGDLSVVDALQRVLRLPSVASKRYLTNKVTWALFMSFLMLSYIHSRAWHAGFKKKIINIGG